MAPHPKKKRSVSRKRRHRTHIAATIPHLIVCTQCRSPKPSHQACPICGTYDGRQVLDMARETRAPSA
ncbi:MAG TPA: 50S ribosomal protein L32 [Dehalococcoidia bacterium]